MPFLLIIPLMVRTLSGGQTRLRLWRHGRECKALSRSFQVLLLRTAQTADGHAVTSESDNVLRNLNVVRTASVFSSFDMKQIRKRMPFEQVLPLWKPLQM